MRRSLATSVLSPRVITREEQMESTSREVDSLDQLDERVRRAFRAHCNFDMSYAVLMRFAQSARRKRLSDEAIADVFKRITSEQEAAKFRSIWSQSV